jgi:hypothetical protein
MKQAHLRHECPAKAGYHDRADPGPGSDWEWVFPHFDEPEPGVALFLG